MSAHVGERSLVDLAARLRANLIPLSRQLSRPDGELTPTELSVLGAVHRHQPITLGELAARERLSPAMISRVVASLEDQAIVDRVADEHDRRVCYVKISETGNRWIEEGRARRNAWLAERLAQLDPAELDTLDAAVPLLERLISDDI